MSDINVTKCPKHTTNIDGGTNLCRKSNTILRCRPEDCCYPEMIEQIHQANKRVEGLKNKISNIEKFINKIRDVELQSLDIDWDEYEVRCRETDYSTIITTCEEALEIINGAKNG